MNSNKNWPDSFYCPLTHDVMKDPVMDPEGNSYEKQAILDWLAKNSTSPVTRSSLKPEDLVPNRALKDTIDTLLNQNVSHGEAVKVVKVTAKSRSDVHLGIDVVSSNGTTLVSIKPNDKITGVNRTPSTVVCVIDISGSMDGEAKIQSQTGQSEGFGFSILDLVKHSVRTIISSLGENDELALVAFNIEARVALGLTKMDDAGKKKAEEALMNLHAQDSTNIWDGLYHGLEVLRNAGAFKKNSAIFLLTDGQPNVVPPRGHLPMLQKYKDEHGLPNVINTFGFGYNLDSKLLHQLAVAGNGAYAFIPDGSFVGTIFVNALSNLLATAATDVCLSIELDKPQDIDYSLIKHYNHQVTSWGVEMQVGSVMFGQSKNFVLPMTIDPSKKLSVTLKYVCPFENTSFNSTQELEVRQSDVPEIEMHILRLMLVNELSKAQEMADQQLYDEALAAVQQLINQFKESKVVTQKYIKDLLEDLEGQAMMALSRKDYWTRWGTHYFPSLIRAHLLQQCNNFKDPGVQNYGGEIFNKVRNIVDDIFVKLPPPSPTYTYQGQTGVKDMSVFYNAFGGCIAGDCLVLMADGSIKLVQDIVKGDLIMGAHGEAVKVVCVVKTMSETNKVRLIEFKSGLKITPWHPIRLGGKFYFPCTVDEPFTYEYHEYPAVYNFVLESHHLMMVNGVECVTLAHGFQEDVVRHEYYGTSAVIDDLRRIEGWEDGLVVLSSGDTKRDANTGMVAGIIRESGEVYESRSVGLTV